MTHHKKSASTSPQRFSWIYPLCSLAQFIVYLFVLQTWLRHHRYFGGSTTEFVGVVFGIVVAVNCAWWFLRCPRQLWVAKLLTVLILVAAVLAALTNIFANLGYRLYGPGA